MPLGCKFDSRRLNKVNFSYSRIEMRATRAITSLPKPNLIPPAMDIEGPLTTDVEVPPTIDVKFEDVIEIVDHVVEPSTHK